MSDIEKLHKVILIIVQEINRICIDHNISYSLDGGTLLGAIRHEGFIPWDDDFDIAMKRDDYERFLEVCRTELDKKRFFLQTDRVDGYAFSFAKIHLNDTEIIEDFSKNANVHHGIFVDIFPYDNLPDKKIIRKVFLINNHILKNLIWVKCNYGSEIQKKRVSYKITKAIGQIFSLKRLKNIRSRYIQKYNDKETLYCFTSDYPKLRVYNRWFESMINYSFEGLLFWGFKEADAFLTMQYNNYMELPPIEERIVHSNYKINFGPYY